MKYPFALPITFILSFLFYCCLSPSNDGAGTGTHVGNTLELAATHQTDCLPETQQQDEIIRTKTIEADTTYLPGPLHAAYFAPGARAPLFPGDNEISLLVSGYCNSDYKRNTVEQNDTLHIILSDQIKIAAKCVCKFRVTFAFKSFDPSKFVKIIRIQRSVVSQKKWEYIYDKSDSLISAEDKTE